VEKEVLQGYLQKLMSLQDEMDHRFTEGDFRIAIGNLGLSDKEKMELDKEFDQQFKQGSNYYRHGNYKRALEYLLVAQQIEPFHLSTLMLVTDCYKHLYLENFSRAYYEQIIESCRRGLKMQAHNPYFAKVETLTEKSYEALKRRSMRLLFIGGGALFLSFALVAAFQSAPAVFGILGAAGAISFGLLASSLLPAAWQLSRLRRSLKRTTLTIKFVTKE